MNSRFNVSLRTGPERMQLEYEDISTKNYTTVYHEVLKRSKRILYCIVLRNIPKSDGGGGDGDYPASSCTVHRIARSRTVASQGSSRMSTERYFIASLARSCNWLSLGVD